MSDRPASDTPGSDTPGFGTPGLGTPGSDTPTTAGAVSRPDDPVVAIGPRTAEWVDRSVTDGGGVVVHVGPETDAGTRAPGATALVWTMPDREVELAEVLDANPQIDWVQLPWAGVDPYRHLFDDGRRWTCAKGAYAPPVAEHALALLLAGFRHIGPFARATSWQRQAGRRLMGSELVILGGGGITRWLLDLLRPFDCTITVVRRSDAPVDPEGLELAPHRVVTVDRLDETLAEADALILTLALTDDSHAIIGPDQLSRLPAGAWVVNVARGEHIDTDALVESLESGHLGGAALDVTAPEPLPDGHRLWSLPNVIITPHSANSRAMAAPLLAERITDNVGRYRSGAPLAGLVDPVLGY